MYRPAVVPFCCGLLLIAATLVAGRIAPTVDLFRFPLCWCGIVLSLQGLARLRQGRSPLCGFSSWATCAGASILFWDVFELVDLRLRNWWYVGVSPNPWAGALFSAVSFATVLPAVRLGLAALTPRGEPVPPPRPRPPPLTLAAAGLGMLGLALLLPRFAFPLAWIFLWPLCEWACSRLPPAGLLSPLEGGRKQWLRLLALALPLGLAWESLNFGCPRGWIYTVPFFDHPRLFEMPLPGYLGYLPFLLEAGAALALVERLRPHLRGARGLAAACALAAVHLGTDRLGRRQTVISFTAPAPEPPHPR